MLKENINRRAMKKIYALGKKRSIDLSLSEDPLGCSPVVFSALKNMKINFNDYPTPNGRLLKKSLAKRFNLNENNLFIANGSESIILDIPRVFGNQKGEVIVPLLTFPMFKICSNLAQKKVISVGMGKDLEIDLSNISKLISQKTEIVFLCNPNNPTGSILEKKQIINLIRKSPKTVLFVVDEANIEFGGESMIDKVKNIKNLLVLRTFSKGFGLANLRIGFAVGNQNLIFKLEEETPPFQVSGLSELLATEALKDDEFIKSTQKFVLKERNILKTKLTEMGFKVFPSNANNLFVKLPNSVDKNDFLMALENKDISLVMGSSFEGFDDDFFRLSIRDEKTNRLFMQFINDIK